MYYDMKESVKECIRRIFWIPVVLGISNGKFTATKGTRWWHFLEWLYGNGEPEFNGWFPDEEK